jgi:histidyl-tRNA synthetase
MSAPSLPKGTRDFAPQEVARRNYIFNTIRAVFELYGYQPIETPVMENLSTLTGKYGDEGDKLLFRILNSGDFFDEVKKKFPAQSVDTISAKDIVALLADKGLRYDLTVPFARFVVMRRNDIALPFKRYQIQPVFRADRPQKGRYREFYQCDADVVGSDSLWNETEFVQIYDTVFHQLQLNVVIKLNHRKVLNGLAQLIQAEDKVVALTVAIDKLDKVGLQGVRQELTHSGFVESQIHTIERFFKIEGDNRSKVLQARALFQGIADGEKGCDELMEVLDKLDISLPLHNKLSIDFTLARGLSYYTGCIFEVSADEGTLKSSIGGGGRYDDLTGIFGVKGLSGVGISFGADRIYDVLEETGKFPASALQSTQILAVNFGGDDEIAAWQAVQQLRMNHIAAELYPQQVKLAKQFKYADDKKIPYVLIIGEEERKAGMVTLKNMDSGEQLKTTLTNVIQKITVK